MFIETTVIYLLVGSTVAAAMALSSPSRSPAPAAGLFVLHALAWPFFAPLVLGRALEDRSPPLTAKPRDATEGDHATDSRIDRAQTQLMKALQRVGPVAEELLGPKMESLQDLCQSLHRMESRLAEMDALLKSDEFDRRAAEKALKDLLDNAETNDGDPRIDSVRSRLRNIDRLHQMRRRARRDLQNALLKMEEMHSQILLLQFAEEQEDEIAENIQEIATTIDGLSESLLAI